MIDLKRHWEAFGAEIVEIEQFVEIDKDGNPYIAGEEPVRSVADFREEEDAVLASAALDLLDAATEAEGIIVTTLKDLLRYAGLPEKEADEHPAVQKLRAAIAKAKGGQS